MQDFEPFYVQLRGEDAYPGRIATRSRHAGRKPAADHVVGHTDDGDGLCRTLRSSDRGIAEGDNEIDILCDRSGRPGRLPEVRDDEQDEATQGRDVSTLAPLRVLRARAPVPAWARRAVGEGVKSVESRMRETFMSGFDRQDQARQSSTGDGAGDGDGCRSYHLVPNFTLASHIIQV